MKTVDLEGWIVRVIELARARQVTEDSRVELKREWPDATKAARRIAGHANAAGGGRILWVIGLDEVTGEAVGVEPGAFADWWARVRKEFDDVTPHPRELVIPVDGKSVVGIVFETDRAPYLVRNPAGGQIQFEVPWRESTGIRTARRNDLLTLVTSVVPAADIEVLGGFISQAAEKDGGLIPYEWVAHLFVTPPADSIVVFPDHRVAAQIRCPSCSYEREFSHVRMGPFRDTHSRDRRIETPLITKDPGVVTVNGPGRVFVSSRHFLPASAEIPHVHGDLSLTLEIAGRASPVTLTAAVEPIPPLPNKSGRRWKVGPRHLGWF